MAGCFVGRCIAAIRERACVVQLTFIVMRFAMDMRMTCITAPAMSHRSRGCAGERES
ncbi:MAG: hypothetical protein AAF830_15030 [Pseudomonadota bacterium]